MKNRQRNIIIPLFTFCLALLTVTYSSSLDESLYSFSKDTVFYYDNVSPDTFSIVNHSMDTLRFDSVLVKCNGEKITSINLYMISKERNFLLFLNEGCTLENDTCSLYYSSTYNTFSINPQDSEVVIVHQAAGITRTFNPKYEIGNIAYNPSILLIATFFTKNYSKQLIVKTNALDGSKGDALENNKNNTKTAINIAPNPFTPRTSISISGLTPQNNHTLNIYDQSGRLVRSLVNHENSSTVNFTWNGTNELGSRLPTGVYIASIKNGQTILRTKLLLIK